MTPVKLGVTLPQLTSDAARLVDGARRAEACGLDSIWLFDHMWPLSGGRERPIFEQWSALAYLAAATTRIELGTLVTRSSLRHAAVTAKMAATVSAIAPGRVTIALGSGDELSRDENEAFGMPYYEGQERIDQLASEVAVVRSYLQDGVVSRTDDFVSIGELPASPRHEPRPPLWVGGVSRGVLEIAARSCDGWNGWGLDPEAFEARVAALRSLGAGESFTMSWAGAAEIAEDAATAHDRARRGPKRDIAGDAEMVAERLGELVAAGADHLIMSFPGAGEAASYELLGERVKPLLGRA